MTSESMAGSPVRPPQAHEWPARPSAWPAVPAAGFLALIVALRVTTPAGTLQPGFLLPVLNLVLTTTVCLAVAILAGRTALAGGHPATLLLGGATIAHALISGLAGLAIPAGQPNIGVTIYNVGLLVVGAGHLGSSLGLVLSPGLRSHRISIGELLASYGSAVGLVIAIASAAFSGSLPVFFTAGQGPSPLRQTVLTLAITEFAVAALLVGFLAVQGRSRFLGCYAAGLLLIGAGLYGLHGISDLGAPLAWAGRATQYAGNIYLLVAAVTAMRESGAWVIPLETLRETHRRHMTLLELFPDPILVHSGTHYLYANPAAARLFGVQHPDQLLGRPVLDVVDSTDRESARLGMQRALETGEPTPLAEVRLRGLDGRLIEAEWAGVRVEYEGRPAIQLVVRDITERKRAEQAMHDAQARLHLGLQVARAFTFEWDVSADSVRRSQNCGPILGLPADQAVHDSSRRYFTRVHPDDREAFKARVLGLTPHEPTYQIRYRLERPDGQVVWLEEAGRGTFDAHGRLVGLIGMTMDVTERAKVQDQLAETATRLLAVLENALDAAYRRDLITDRYDYMSPVFSRITGYSLDKLSGMSIDEYLGRVHPEDRPQLHAAIEAGTKAGEGTVEYRFRCADGSYRWLSDQYTITRDSRGRALYRGGFVRDTTERREMEEQLRQASAAAEAANRAKDEFLAVLSHELRTPLMPVLMITSHLQQDPRLPETFRGFIGMIRRNVDLEARLIDDLLDLTRISRGKLNLNLQTVDARELIQQAFDTCGGEAADKSVHMELDLRAEHSLLRGDPARIQQVFWNLMKNAIKFTPAQGQVRVEMENTLEADTRRLVVRVSDTGVGIDPQLLPRLFQPFQQGGQEVTRQFGGLGLGLAISKSLVEMHGGRITAESQGPGRGACFTVVLDSAEPEPVDTARRGGPLSPACALDLLLVEDHPDTREMLKLVLEDAGHRVVVAGCVGEGLRAARARHFDLVVSDISLPDGTGYDLMRQLSVEGPVLGIAVTGHGMESDLDRARAAGFLAHLTKPINAEQLHATIARIAGRPADSNTPRVL